MEEAFELLKGCGSTDPCPDSRGGPLQPLFFNFFLQHQKNPKGKLSFLRTLMKNENIAKFLWTGGDTFNSTERGINLQLRFCKIWECAKYSLVFNSTIAALAVGVALEKSNLQVYSNFPCFSCNFGVFSQFRTISSYGDSFIAKSRSNEFPCNYPLWNSLQSIA